MKPQFCHLRIHTEYSVVDGLVRLDELFAAAAADSQAALALTDLNNMFGMVKFYKGARSKGLKPIIGCDVVITNDADRNRPYRLLLLAKNNAGYLALCELVSRAWLENQHIGRAEVKRAWLEELTRNRGDSDLIALSSTCDGDVGQALLAEDPKLATERARYWQRVFCGEFYLEVQRVGREDATQLCAPTVLLGDALQIPVVATHPVQFLRREEFNAHEARICIAQGNKIADSKRPKMFTADQCFATQEEMASMFADIPQTLSNSVAIATKCNVTLVLGKPQLPDFPVPLGMTVDAFLREQSAQGLDRRLEHLYPDPVQRSARRTTYYSRLTYELDVICNMKFPGYFLIVAEFINWAKQNGVPVGPGRGSGAGSLVAYALQITDLDPLAYNLLFERFLNPERVSMPDFDIDFCQIGRDRVIQHVKDLYGKKAVSQIATFGTMAAKGAIRDVGRVMDLSYGMCDGIAKLIPNKPGKTVTISDSMEEEPALRDRYNNEFEVRQLLDLAQQVEGITRNVGMHAGGVLIAPGKLTDFSPLYTQAGDAGIISQYDKDDVEAVGLVKFDFLGLTTLTILDLTVRYIEQLEAEHQQIRLESLPLDDARTYQLLSEAHTVAVFQLESKGMQGMLKDARPDRFEDIIALVALYRPGPMDLIPDFCRRKHGEPFTYPDPRTENILSETYGIMVYQEQVMQMAQVVGGYTLGGADLLRRAMGKKKVEEMAQQRQLFREGASKTGLSTAKADEIFDLMEKFAGYGFNKSHAAAYALLSYQTAYLKVHYPACFMAANLSLAIGDTDKIKVLYDDAIEACSLSFLPPDINQSDYYFTPVASDDGQLNQIRFGLGAIKGVGEGAVAAIVEARANQPFTDLFELVRRVGKEQANKRTLEALAKAGAFDSWGISRGVILASIQAALGSVRGSSPGKQQTGLFDVMDEDNEPAPYGEAPDWTRSQELAEERSVMGFYLSGHPYQACAAELSHIVGVRLGDITATRDPVVVGGIISAIRTNNTARGKMCTVTLDDGVATLDVTVFSELYHAHRDMLQPDHVLVVRGKAAPDKFSGGIRVTAESMWDINGARLAFCKDITVRIDDGIDVAALRDLLEEYKHPDGLAVFMERQVGQAIYAIALGPSWKLNPSDELLETARLLCPGDAVRFTY